MGHVEERGRGGEHASTSSQQRGYRHLCDNGGTSENLTYLDALKEKVLYCDTDSVIYIHKCGQPPAVTCGDTFGDMTKELGSDEYISEFVSGGPKNYAYKILNAKTSAKKTVCKMRGITLNYTESQFVNFDSIKNMILCADVKDVITVRTERKIKRKLRKCDGSGPSSTDMVTVVSEPEEKNTECRFASAGV